MNTPNFGFHMCIKQSSLVQVRVLSTFSIKLKYTMLLIEYEPIKEFCKSFFSNGSTLKPYFWNKNIFLVFNILQG